MLTTRPADAPTPVPPTPRRARTRQFAPPTVTIAELCARHPALADALDPARMRAVTDHERVFDVSMAVDAALEDLAAAGNDFYLHGHCAILAVVLVERLPGTTLGMVTDHTGLVHAFAVEPAAADGAPDGPMVIDAAGRQSLMWARAEFETGFEVEETLDAAPEACLRLNYGRRGVPAYLRRAAQAYADVLLALLAAHRTVEAQDRHLQSIVIPA